MPPSLSIRDRLSRRRLAAFCTAALCLPMPGFSADPPKLAEPDAGQTAACGADDTGCPFVARIDIVGSTLIPEADLRAFAAPYEGRRVPVEDLVRLRDALTRAYVDAGYVSSGARFPPQDLSGGVVTIEVVEGRLDPGDVAFLGNAYLDGGFLLGRLGPLGDGPLNVGDLNARLDLLGGLGAVDAVDARLLPGEEEGESRLEIDVREAPRFGGGIIVDNENTPLVGQIRTSAFVSVTSVFGVDDPLYARVGVARGLRDFEGIYSFPVEPGKSQAFLGWKYSDSRIVDDPLEELRITTSLLELDTGLEVNVLSDAESELAALGGFRFRTSETTILDTPFPGRDDGKTSYAMAALGARWTRFWEDAAFSLRGDVNFGAGRLGLEANPLGGEPPHRFAYLLGQAGYARRLDEEGRQISARLTAQLALSQLPLSEQFEIGGFDTVRGYRENTLLRDSGVVASLEGLVPLVAVAWPGATSGVGDPNIYVRPFLDAGVGWDFAERDATRRDPKALASVGAGLLWAPTRLISAKVDVGLRLIDANYAGAETLQDLGIQFSVRLGGP